MMITQMFLLCTVYIYLNVCRVPSLMFVSQNQSVYHYTDTDNIDTAPVFNWVQDCLTTETSTPPRPLWTTTTSPWWSTSRTTRRTTTPSWSVTTTTTRRTTSIATTPDIETTSTIELELDECNRMCTADYR